MRNLTNLATPIRGLTGALALAGGMAPAMLALPIATSDAYAATSQTSMQASPAPAASLTPAQAQARSKAIRARQRGDHMTAITLLQPLADTGDPEAQNAIGEMSIAGKDARVTRDEAQAAAWFRKAAVQGFAPGQVNLGLML